MNLFGRDRHIALEIAMLQQARPDEPITVAALIEATGYSDSTIRRATRRMVALGTLRRCRVLKGYLYEVVHV